MQKIHSRAMPHLCLIFFHKPVVFILTSISPSVNRLFQFYRVLYLLATEQTITSIQNNPLFAKRKNRQ